MFQIRNLGVFLGLFAAPLAFGQSLPLNLQPGDIIIADTPQNLSVGAVRILRANGTVDTVLEAAPLDYPGGILLDRDGAILVATWTGQWSPKNGVLRLAPGGGAVPMINNQPLEDNFDIVRDSNGDLVVADGYAGIARIDYEGEVDWYSLPGPDHTPLGVDLDFDGNILAAVPPAYSNNSSPGYIASIAQDGSYSVLIEEPALLHSPNDVSLAPDGTLIATNFSQYYPLNDAARLVHCDRAGNVTALATNGLLRKPKGVHINEWGSIYVGDVVEQAVLTYGPVLGMQHVLWDMADGVDDGDPVERPFAIEQVPSLWLRSEYQAVAGTTSEVRVSSIPAYWGESIVLAISRQHGDTAMNSIWPTSARHSHLDLSNPQLVFGSLPANGSDWTFSGPVPGALAGMALHLQVFLPSDELLSNYIALPVL